MMALLLGAALAAPATWELGVETNRIGRHTGPSGALLWGEGANHLRLGFGLMSNLESIYAPAAIGWRGAYLRSRAVGPILGAGLQAQYFWSRDMQPVVRPGLYLEAGLVVRAGPGSFALTAGPDLALLTEPGPGLALRLTFSPGL